MTDKKRKQPGYLMLVLIVGVLVLGVSLFLSSGMVNSNAGAVTYEKMSEENMVPVGVKDGEDYYILLADGKLLTHDEFSKERGNTIETSTQKYPPVLTFGDGGRYHLTALGDGIYFDSNGEEEIKLDVPKADLDNVWIAPNARSFLMNHMGDLYVFNISNKKLKNYILVDEGVEEVYYTINNDFVYLKEGAVLYCSGGYKHQIAQNAAALFAARDSGVLYYLAENVLVRFQVGGTKDVNGAVVLDEEVTDFYYLGNDTLCYIKDDVLYIASGIETQSLNINGQQLMKPEEISQ